MHFSGDSKDAGPGRSGLVKGTDHTSSEGPGASASFLAPHTLLASRARIKSGTTFLEREGFRGPRHMEMSP